jgi:hypothetical protein
MSAIESEKLPMTPPSKPKIRIGFTDFWPEFDKSDNYFTRLLAESFDVEVTESPDFLIFSNWGWNHTRFKCIRIFYTGEPLHPSMCYADYSFTFDFIESSTHFRLPLYGMLSEAPALRGCRKTCPEDLIKSADFARRAFQQKTKFCAFVVSNPNGKKRNEFFEKLSKYKQVDSCGRYKNNIGGPVGDKMQVLPQYKFTMAFENSEYPGYTSEKIAEPMLAGSLPVYWGNPLIHRDFDPASFLNYYDFEDDEAVIDRIIELDQDDEKYQQVLQTPWYHGNQVNDFVNQARVLAQFQYIFSVSLPRPAALTWKAHFAEEVRPAIGKYVSWRKIKHYWQNFLANRRHSN